MRRRAIIIGVVGFWLVMMATLVRRWLREQGVPGTYQGVLTPERRNSQQRMGIYWRGKRVGYTQTLFFCEDGKYTIQNVTRVLVAIPGVLPKQTPFDIDSTVLVGADHSLERLWIRVEAKEVLRAECRGTVVNGKLVLRPTLNGQRKDTIELEMPSGKMVGQQLSPLLAPRRLRKGMRWSVTLIDPFTQTPLQVDARVLRHEYLVWEGRQISTHVVEMRSGLFMVTRAWVARGGEVLKQKIALGVLAVTFIKEPIPEEERLETK